MHEDFTRSAADKLQQQGFSNILLKTGDALAKALPEGPFDVIAVTGSVATSEQTEIFRQQLRIGGRLFTVIGTAPPMEAMLITRTGEKAFSEEAIFETDIKPLTNAEAPRTFEF
jgi:protein-L-isoaspartate(D-aspartate) O-methyltransferase